MGRGKRVELLREAVNPANPSSPPRMKDTSPVARSYGLAVRFLELRDFSQVERAFATAVQDRARAVIARMWWKCIGARPCSWTTAKALDVEIPSPLLQRADRVIE